MSQLHLSPALDVSSAPKDLTGFLAAGGKLVAAPDSDDDTVDPTPQGDVLAVTTATTDDNSGNGNAVPRVSIGPDTEPLVATHPAITDTNTLTFAHGTDWQSHPIMCKVDQNGPLPKIKWATKDPMLHMHTEGGDVSQRLSRLDYFQ